jgi:hypothetical protein
VSRGQTAQAERELPDQVDSDRDSGLLERFGSARRRANATLTITG